MRKVLIVLCLAMSGSALAATAYFSGQQRVGMSVTGQSILVCGYTYGGQSFERAFPYPGLCPMSVEVF